MYPAAVHAATAVASHTASADVLSSRLPDTGYLFPVTGCQFPVAGYQVAG